MRHIRVLVCQGDDGTPDLMSELACFDLATEASGFSTHRCGYRC